MRPFSSQRRHLYRDVLRDRLAGKGGQHLPDRFAALSMAAGDLADNSGRPRQFHTFMQHMNGTINNRIFEMTGVAEEEVVQLGAHEVWEFVNRGGMPALPHPMHVHGLQFRVLGRMGGLYSGYLDEGWKDTVMLMPGERVRLLMRFEDYDGLFLYHCHNLEHEDMGMMRNYYVRKV